MLELVPQIPIFDAWEYPEGPGIYTVVAGYTPGKPLYGVAQEAFRRMAAVQGLPTDDKTINKLFYDAVAKKKLAKVAVLDVQATGPDGVRRVLVLAPTAPSKGSPTMESVYAAVEKLRQIPEVTQSIVTHIPLLGASKNLSIEAVAEILVPAFSDLLNVAVVRRPPLESKAQEQLEYEAPPPPFSDSESMGFLKKVEEVDKMLIKFTQKPTLTFEEQPPIPITEAEEEEEEEEEGLMKIGPPYTSDQDKEKALKSMEILSKAAKDYSVKLAEKAVKQAPVTTWIAQSDTYAALVPAESISFSVQVTSETMQQDIEAAADEVFGIGKK